MFTKTSLLATALLLAAVPAFAEAPVATAPAGGAAVSSQAASNQAVTKPTTPNVEAKRQSGTASKPIGHAEQRGEAMKPAHPGKVAGTAAGEHGMTTRTN
jgi:hypothetical protein